MKEKLTVTKRVLIAGESWTVHSIHQKGFDSFTTTEYAEGVRWLREALEIARLEGRLPALACRGARVSRQLPRRCRPMTA